MTLQKDIMKITSLRFGSLKQQNWIQKPVALKHKLITKTCYILPKVWRSKTNNSMVKSFTLRRKSKDKEKRAKSCGVAPVQGDYNN